MDRLDEWIQKISEGGRFYDGTVDTALHIEIADKILELLEQKKSSLSAREKILFARAVTELSTIVKSYDQPNEAGLRRCLIALAEAMIPEDVLNESFVENDDEARPISYAMLVSTVRLIKAEH